MYQDKVLTCRECGQEFTFTASEQAFYAEKGFQNEPGRCPACRAARRANGNSRPSNSNNNGGEREMHEVICDGCGCTTQVPFQPKGDRPVYCRECFAKMRAQRY